MSLRAPTRSPRLYDLPMTRCLRRRLRLHIKNAKSRRIVEQGLELLVRLTTECRRGRPQGRDGAGILVQISRRLLPGQRRVRVAPGGSYGVGMVFLPQDGSPAR